MQYPILKKIIHFPLSKMLAGIAIIFAAVLLGEAIRRWLPGSVVRFKERNDLIVAIIQISLSLSGYILLYRKYEQRDISELNSKNFFPFASTGLSLAFVIQSSNILFIYLLGTYEVQSLNPIAYLLPGFIAAIVAGFIAEIALRGILFRLMEDSLGTIISLILISILFGIMHVNSNGANFISVWATIAQAGWLSCALYIYTRSLWPPIFFHLAWDFAEPAIFGGLNPGISLDKTLLSSRIDGPGWLSGGSAGPGNSLQSAIICTILSALFLWMGKSKFKKPFWI